MALPCLVRIVAHKSFLVALASRCNRCARRSVECKMPTAATVVNQMGIQIDSMIPCIRGSGQARETIVCGKRKSGRAGGGGSSDRDGLQPAIEPSIADERDARVGPFRA